MKNIVREVFSLPAMDVVKASYKNSVYYIAGSSDITEYVSTIKSSFDVSEVDAIKHGLNAFLKEHPMKNTLSVPKFNLVILNNYSWTDEFIISVLQDLFRKDDDEAQDIASSIYYNGSCSVGTYTYELAHTFACMIETINVQMNSSIETDIVPATNYKSESMDSLEVIENLIRRDFPGDI